jgi:hypothetical protein
MKPPVEGGTGSLSIEERYLASARGQQKCPERNGDGDEGHGFENLTIIIILHQIDTKQA